MKVRFTKEFVSAQFGNVYIGRVAEVDETLGAILIGAELAEIAEKAPKAAPVEDTPIDEVEVAPVVKKKGKK